MSKFWGFSMLRPTLFISQIWTLMTPFERAPFRKSVEFLNLQNSSFRVTLYLISCSVFNPTPPDIPGPPLDVNAVLLGTNSAMVSWLPPTDTGSCPITSYVIQRKQLQSENWEEVHVCVSAWEEMCVRVCVCVWEECCVCGGWLVCMYRAILANCTRPKSSFSSSAWPSL